VTHISELLVAGDAGLFKMIRRWEGILVRCHDPRNEFYPLYGGRGIYVCKEWHEFQSFFDFWGLPPSPRASMERIDNDKGYMPANCKWALVGEQNMNTRRNKFIEYNGETKTMTQWAEVYDINPVRLSERLRRGWPVDKAFETPCRTGFAEGRRRHIENNKKQWDRNGRQYASNSHMRRRAGLLAENGLLTTAKNHRNLI
jgi:hypothetical protein